MDALRAADPAGPGLDGQDLNLDLVPNLRQGSALRPSLLPTRIYTRLGKQTLGAHKQNHVHTRTQEKGAVTPQETDPDLLMSVQDSPVKAWVGGGLLQRWGR